MLHGENKNAFKDDNVGKVGMDEFYLYPEFQG